MKSTIPQFDTFLSEAIQTWTELKEDVVRIKFQAEMEEAQQQQERLKYELKMMSPIQRMQKYYDSKTLNQ